MPDPEMVFFFICFGAVAALVVALFVRAHAIAARIRAQNPKVESAFDQLLKHKFRRSDEFRRALEADPSLDKDVRRFDGQRLIVPAVIIVFMLLGDLVIFRPTHAPNPQEVPNVGNR